MAKKMWHVISPLDRLEETRAIPIEEDLAPHYCPECAAEGGTGFEWLEAMELETWPPREIRRESLVPGRNDPCPCGSGVKYKKCCLN